MKYMDNYAQQYADCAWLSFEELESFMREALIHAGIPAEDAAIISDVLIESDKRGIDSHGIGRLKPIYIDRIDMGIMNPVTKIDVIKDKAAAAVWDANNGMGHVASYKAMEKAIEKAKQYGLGMVTVRNSNHYGIAGYYVTMATKAGLLGITGTNARPSIAPTFGVENMMGTNPLTFGFPTDEEFPFVFDAATSVTQRGKIEVYGRANKELPKGWVVDHDGKTRTDTQQVLKDLTTGFAALTPLGGIGEETGGHKGYGYAVVVEILSAALQAGAWMKALNGFDENQKPIPYPLGHFFIAIDPDFFMGLDTFKKTAGSICRELRASQKAPGEDYIFTAGEKEHLAYEFRKANGCPVPPALQNVMTTLRDRYKMNMSWSFEKK